jgi:hypothetical protein
MSSVTRSRSLAKSTVAKKALRSPLASAADWRLVLHDTFNGSS